IGKIVRAHIGVIGDARRVLRALGALTPAREARDWLMQIDALRRDHQPRPYRSDRAAAGVLPPSRVYEALRRAIGASPGDIRVVTDVGQHQMWAAQLLEWRRPRTHLTSGGS